MVKARFIGSRQCGHGGSGMPSLYAPGDEPAVIWNTPSFSRPASRHPAAVSLLSRCRFGSSVAKLSQASTGTRDTLKVGLNTGGVS
jgi:hypothetical protein